MRAPLVALVVALAVLVSACGRVFEKKYEYEEELYLDLDGSVTAYVNASVPALVALRGADLDVNPRARLDRERVRTLFAAPGVEVSRVSLSRREGRRFVHVRVDAARLEDLRRSAPFAWSSYQLTRRDEVVEFHQVVGGPAVRSVGSVGWTGAELVAFRMHLPSRIPFHNSKEPIQRGNILRWEQPLSERLKGVPVDMEAHMEPESILRHTLLLFGGTIVAAAATFALVIWWIARKGRTSPVVESRS